MSCTSRIFRPKIATFSQLQVYLNATQAKQMINLVLLNNSYPVDIIPTSSKEKESDEFIVHGSVARYGPQSIASASG